MINWEAKTDDEILSLVAEARRERTRLNDVIKQGINVLNRRGQLPEIPDTHRHYQPLTPDQTIKFAKFLGGHPTTQQTIEYVEHLMKGKQ